MKGRRVTRRKKKGPARGSRGGWGISNMFKSKKPVEASAPVAVPVAASASAPVVVPVAVPVEANAINEHGVPYARPLNTLINGVPVAMAVDKPIATHISNKETNKKVDLTNLKYALISAINAGNKDRVESVLQRLRSQFKSKTDSENDLKLKNYLNLIDRNGINLTDSNGMTPLMLAISKGNIPIVKLLIDKGAKINAEQAKTLREKVAVSKVNAEKAKRIQNTLNFVLNSTAIGTPLANQNAAATIGGRKKHTRKNKKHHK